MRKDLIPAEISKGSRADCSGTLGSGVRGLTKIRWSERQPDLGSPSSVQCWASTTPFSSRTGALDVYSLKKIKQSLYLCFRGN